MRVGFIGLGTMGGSMALNVRAAGYDIVINDIRRDAGARLQANSFGFDVWILPIGDLFVSKFVADFHVRISNFASVWRYF